MSAAACDPSPSRARLLILSFSPIARDARVLKQVRLLAPRYTVTTCGYGPAPEGVADHVQIPDELLAWRLDRASLILGRFEQAQRMQETVAWAREHLRRDAYDVVLADDAETVPLALWLRPVGGVHADLHEYASRQKEGNLRWRTFVAPYVRWLVRTYVARADSVTTIAPGIAEEYEREFGIRAQVVTNASPLRRAPVGRTHQPLRLVHSGAALPDRHLEVMIEAMREVTTGARLDLYLTPNDPGLIDRLRHQADEVCAQAGEERVRVLDPVPYTQLVETLAEYDVGVFSIPPVSFNYRMTLPNKLFDFVQARLAIVVSPSPEMARVVREHGLGRVTEGFTAQDLARTLNELDEQAVRGYREAADRAAEPLSAERQVGAWLEAIDALAARADARPSAAASAPATTHRDVRAPKDR